MIINLCIANALALWMTSNRDQVVANVIKQHTANVKTLVISVTKPVGIPVSCKTSRDFIDKWFKPALKNEGVFVEEIKHAECNPEACICENELDVCVLGSK